MRHVNDRLFVYGSLMRGMSSNAKLAKLPGARRVGRGWIRGRLLDLEKYPGVVRSPESRVFGELWEVARRPNVLRELDQYEGIFPEQRHHSLFERRRVRVHLGESTLTAWAYFLVKRPKAAAVIQEGDWRARVRRLKRSTSGLDFPR